MQKLPAPTRILGHFEEETLGGYDITTMPLDDASRAAARSVAVECHEQLEKRHPA